MYKVFNICGGMIYHGKDLKKAIDCAEQQFSSPYIHSANGKRPVLNGNIGKFGQDYDDFQVELMEEEYPNLYKV